VAVSADQDLHIRPVGTDRAHQAAEKGPDLDAVRPFRRAHERRDEATILIEDDDRLEAILVIVGVEQPQLCTASKVSSMSSVIRRGTCAGAAVTITTKMPSPGSSMARMAMTAISRI
jgi:hypothetical protein